ncbi:MAG: neutral/alkaline non-lysosomal ceramidase N-terminal domain-containing protein, partial [Planctomycetota bacterium]|nr:neutral/alkaline non-lysosomal ceramidase N-terminal domain-containing protein [Planctomycetota bacterium]
MKFRTCLLFSCLLVISPAAQADPVAVGVAKIDVTPTHPVALAGYGGRTKEHEGVDTKIWARALAIGAKDPAVIVAVDNCGIPANVTREVAKKLEKGHGVKPGNLVLAVTHTHCAPSLRDYAVVVWGGRATAAQKANMNKYTDWLIDRIVEAAA